MERGVLIERLHGAVQSSATEMTSLDYAHSLASVADREVSVLVVSSRGDASVSVQRIVEKFSNFAVTIAQRFADSRGHHTGYLTITGRAGERRFEVVLKLTQFRKPSYDELRDLLLFLDSSADDGAVCVETMEWLVEAGILYRDRPKHIDLTDLGEAICDRLRKGEDAPELRK